MNNFESGGNNKNIIISIILIIVLIGGVIFAFSLTNNSSEEKNLDNKQTLALSYIEAIENYMEDYENNPSAYSLKLESGKTYKAEEINSIIGSNVVKPTTGVITIGKNNKVESADIIIDDNALSCFDGTCNSTTDEEVLDMVEKVKSSTKKEEPKKEEPKKEETKKEESKKETVTPTPAPQPAPAPQKRYQVTTSTCRQTGQTCTKTSKKCQKETRYKVTKQQCVDPCPDPREACLDVMPYAKTLPPEYADTCTVELDHNLSCGRYVNPEHNPSYITACELQEEYKFGASSVTNNLSSCSNKSISCNASTVGQTNDSCSCSATYGFETSTATSTSCSVGYGFDCSAATNNQSYVSNCQEI